MLCGSRALADYGIKQAQAREISALLCAKVNETAEAVSQLKDENNALKYAAVELEKKLVRCHAEMIPANEEPVCIFTDDLEGESMRGLMNLVLEDGHLLCAVLHGNEADGYRYVMGAGRLTCVVFAKGFNSDFNGRGGGSTEMVQGTVKGDPDMIRAWIIEKAGGAWMQGQIYRKYPFWSLAGPFLGFLAIQTGVQFIIQLAIELPYLLDAYTELMRETAAGSIPAAQEIMDVYVQTAAPALRLIAAHQVEIAAAASGATLVLTGILFAKDRKLEKRCGMMPPGRRQRGNTGCCWFSGRQAPRRQHA